MLITCGLCDNAATAHPVIITDPFDGPVLICDRTHEDIVNPITTADNYFGFSDYDADSGLTVLDLDGSNAYLERGEATEDAYEYDTLTGPSMWEAVESYRDNHPDEYTSATEAWVGTKPAVPYVYPAGCKQAVGNITSVVNLEAGQSRNVYFPSEDNLAGITVQAYDPHLTELYAHRLLNFYVDKRTGSLRVGGVELFRDHAKCVQHNCKAVLTKPEGDVTRETMEDYVLSIIRHGNNHAAAWFTNRTIEVNGVAERTYYKVHADYCDLACDSSASHCGTIESVVERSLALLAETLNTRPHLKVA